MSDPSRREPRHVLQQHKLAKDLIRAAHGGDPAATARLRAVLGDRPRFKLADAQLVIARDAGFESWPKLIRHVEQQELAAAHEAFRSKNAAELRRLLAGSEFLRSKINTTVQEFGRNPIHCIADDVAMLEVLLEFGADPNLKSDWENGPYLPLDHATDESARFLIKHGAELTANVAARLGWLDELRRLLDEDPARVHARGGDGKQPLHEAKTVEIAELLMNRGADLDALCIDHKSTPAQYALADRPAVCRAILARGARPDAFIAARLGDLNLARRLIDADRACVGARVNLEGYPAAGVFNIYCWTLGWYKSPRMVAAEAGHREVADLFKANSDDRALLLDAVLSEDEAESRAIVSRVPDIVSRLPHGDHRIFSHITHFGRPKVFEIMLDLGFDPMQPGHDGGSAFHHSCWVAADQLVELLLRKSKAKLDFEKRDPSHNATPLGWAVYGSRHCPYSKGDYAKTVVLLLEAGAQIESLSKDGAVVKIEQLDASDAVKQALREHQDSTA